MKLDKNLQVFADFFLPRFCLCCNEKLDPATKVICDICFSQIQTVDQSRLAHEYNNKFLEEKIIENFFSLFLFESQGNIQTLLHELKYNNKFTLGMFLGKHLAEASKEILDAEAIDLIIPMPLHSLKKAERGYNQAYFIAKGFVKIIDKPITTKAVKRKKYTESQTKLTAEERKENMSNAFAVSSPKQIENKNILLIDDVVTSGATVSALGRELKENKANRIFAVSVALAD